MKNFYFRPENYVEGVLADGDGNSCVIGQFLRQECHYEENYLESQNCEEQPYTLFRTLTGFSNEDCTELFEVNDSELPLKTKIKKFRELFGKYDNYKFVVKKCP